MDSADMWRMVVARTSNMWSCREDSRGVAHGESCGEARQGRQEGGISVAKIWQQVKEAAGGAPGGPETGPSAPWEAGQSISCQSCQCSRCCAHSGGRARPPAGGEERERKGKGRDGEGGMQEGRVGRRVSGRATSGGVGGAACRAAHPAPAVHCFNPACARLQAAQTPWQLRQPHQPSIH